MPAKSAKPNKFRLIIILALVAVLSYVGVSLAANAGVFSSFLAAPDVNWILLEDPTMAKSDAQTKAIQEVNKAANTEARTRNVTVKETATADLLVAGQALQTIRTGINTEGEKVNATTASDAEKEIAAARAALVEDGTITKDGLLGTTKIATQLKETIVQDLKSATSDGSWPTKLGVDTCNTNGSPVKAGTWVATGGIYNDNKAQRACVMCTGQSGREGWSYDTEHAKACDAVIAAGQPVVLPPQAGTAYTGFPDFVILKDGQKGYFGSCYSGSLQIGMGQPNPNDAGKVCGLSGRWVDSGTYQDQMDLVCGDNKTFANGRCQTKVVVKPPTAPTAPTNGGASFCQGKTNGAYAKGTGYWVECEDGKITKTSNCSDRGYDASNHVCNPANPTDSRLTINYSDLDKCKESLESSETCARLQGGGWGIVPQHLSSVSNFTGANTSSLSQGSTSVPQPAYIEYLFGRGRGTNYNASTEQTTQLSIRQVSNKSDCKPNETFVSTSIHGQFLLFCDSPDNEVSGDRQIQAPNSSIVKQVGTAADCDGSTFVRNVNGNSVLLCDTSSTPETEPEDSTYVPPVVNPRTGQTLEPDTSGWQNFWSGVRDFFTPDSSFNPRTGQGEGGTQNMGGDFPVEEKNDSGSAYTPPAVNPRTGQPIEPDTSGWQNFWSGVRDFFTPDSSFNPRTGQGEGGTQNMGGDFPAEESEENDSTYVPPVVNPRTGQTLEQAENPDYNPNLFTDNRTTSRYRKANEYYVQREECPYPDKFRKFSDAAGGSCLDADGIYQISAISEGRIDGQKCEFDSQCDSNHCNDNTTLWGIIDTQDKCSTPDQQ